MCFDHHSQEMKEQVLSSDSSRREDLCRRVCVYSYILITVPAVSVSLPGPRLAPGLPSDRTDSRQGKNGSSYLKRCAMDINRCVQRRSCHSQHHQHHRHRPASDLIIRCWGCTRDTYLLILPFICWLIFVLLVQLKPIKRTLKLPWFHVSPQVYYDSFF